MTRIVSILAISAIAVAPVFGQSTDDLLNAAAKALRAKQTAEALKLATKAVDADPASIAALSLRASIYETLDKHAEAAADYRKIIDAIASTHQSRGVAAFKAGNIKESVEE